MERRKGLWLHDMENLWRLVFADGHNHVLKDHWCQPNNIGWNRLCKLCQMNLTNVTVIRDGPVVFAAGLVLL